ncbi:MAG: hypothetical protein ACK4SY_08555 [Pyrobaculum sp.]
MPKVLDIKGKYISETVMETAKAITQIEVGDTLVSHRPRGRLRHKVVGEKKRT